MKNSPFMVKIKERHVEAVAIGNSITNLLYHELQIPTGGGKYTNIREG